jgi:hypothetical protein
VSNYPSYEIFPTGKRTFQFDIAEHIAEQVGALTIDSAAWVVDAGPTVASSSHTDSAVTVTISSSGLTEGDTFQGVCSVTFSDTQVHQFAVNFVVKYLSVKLS